MAFRFGDSFSHYATAQLQQKWPILVFAGSGSFVTINNTGGRTGKGALSAVTAFVSQTYAQKTLDSQPTWTMGAAISYTGAPNMGLMFVMDGSTRQIGLAVNTNGTVYIEKNGLALATSTNTLASGYNYIEWTMTFNGGSGSATVKVNGQSYVTFSGNITHTANDSANSVCLGDWIGPSVPITILYCDFYALDGTTSTNNTFWGDITVEAVVPTGDGHYTDFTAVGAGSAHAAVNEEPPDGDTSYIVSNTVSDRETFTFPGPSGIVLQALALQTVMDVRKESSGIRSIAASVRISSTDYDGTASFLTSHYGFFVEPRNLNPATSSAWGSTDFAAIEAGIEIVS